jgi:hypothetical protein
LEQLGEADAGNMLYWDGGSWRSGTLPLEPDLTRITALSWRHAGTTHLRITHNGKQVYGLAIGFGTDSNTQTTVQAGTLNNNTFRIFLRTGPTSDSDVAIFPIAELQPEAVLPVNITPTSPTDVLITETENPVPELEANGVLFQIDENSAKALSGREQVLFIQLAGDHILDSNGKAIDAEYLHSSQTSDDRPANAELGIQGGRFESWVTVSVTAPISPLIIIDGRDINRAEAADLETLPGIGQVLADRIVRLREERNGFDRFEELREVKGMTDSVLANLRAMLKND